ncbi:hypothetical protein BCR44DRAFT_23638 [Catenaria anguillulae PL171]|uniref:Knl1 C-terminal RWD domain-containing protein n=1 Tax=Catenaria anguillulae PL171 TaxID=765915 RepID=A0A1Y2HUA9_9FUNG|nr:hypothetical protein BCR44DRAFT_23638 [Catenaria anguillulae PL171]
MKRTAYQASSDLASSGPANSNVSDQPLTDHGQSQSQSQQQQQGSRPPKAMRLHPHPPVMSSPLRQPPVRLTPRVNVHLLLLFVDVTDLVHDAQITATASPDQQAHQRQALFNSPTPSAPSSAAMTTPAQGAARAASSSVAEGISIAFSTPSASQLQKQQQHRQSLGGAGILVRPDQQNRTDDRRKSMGNRRVSFAVTKHIRVLSGFLPFTLPNLTSTGGTADSKSSAFSDALISSLTSSSTAASATALASATPTPATPSSTAHDHHGAESSEPSSLLSYDAPLNEPESIGTLSSTASPYPTTPRSGHAHHFVHTPGSTVSAMHHTFGESPIHPSTSSPGSHSPFVTGSFGYSPHHHPGTPSPASVAATDTANKEASTGHQADDDAEDYFRNLGSPALPSQFLAQAHQAEHQEDSSGDLTAAIYAEFGAGIAAAKHLQMQQREREAAGTDRQLGSPAPASPARGGGGPGGVGAGSSPGAAGTSRASGLYPDLGDYVAKVVEQGQAHALADALGSPEMDGESGTGSYGGSGSGSGVEDDGNDLMRYINDFGGEEEDEEAEAQPQPQPQQPEPEREPEQGDQGQQGAAEPELQQEQDDMIIDKADQQPSPQPSATQSPKLTGLGLAASQPLPSRSPSSPEAPPPATSFSQPAPAAASAAGSLFPSASTASSTTFTLRRGTFGGPTLAGPGSGSSWSSAFGDTNRRSTFGGALAPKAPASPGPQQDQETAAAPTQEDDGMDVDPPLAKSTDGTADPDAKPQDQDDVVDKSDDEGAQTGPSRELSPIVRSSVSPPPAATRSTGTHSPEMGSSLMRPPATTAVLASQDRRESLIKMTDAMLSPLPARHNQLQTTQEEEQQQEQPPQATSPAQGTQANPQPQPQPHPQAAQPLMSPAAAPPSTTAVPQVQLPPQTPTTNPMSYAHPMTGSRTVSLPPSRATAVAATRISSTPQPKTSAPIAPLRTLQDTLNEIVARKSSIVGTPAAAARLAAISSPARSPALVAASGLASRSTLTVPSTPASGSMSSRTPRAPMPQSTARVLSADAFGTSSRSELLDLMTPGRAMRRVASADESMSPARLGPSVHIGRRTPMRPLPSGATTPGSTSARLMPGRPETPLSGRVNRMLLGSAWEKQRHDMQGTPSKAARGKAGAGSSPFASSPRPMPSSSGSAGIPSGLESDDDPEAHVGDVSDLMQLSMPELVDADLGDPRGAAVDESSNDPADILKHIIASGSQQFVFKNLDMHDHLLPLPSNNPAQSADPLATAPKYQLVGRDFQLLQSTHELCNYYMRRILSGAAEAADIEAAIVQDARERGEYPKLWQMWIESRDNPTMREFLVDKLNYLISHLNNVTRAEHLVYREQQLQALCEALEEALGVFRVDVDELKERLYVARYIAARLEELMEERREKIRKRMEQREARERAIKDQVSDMQNKITAARAHRLAVVQALNERHAEEEAARAKVEQARARNQELRAKIAQAKNKKDILSKVPTLVHLEQELRLYEHLASATGWTIDPNSRDKLVFYYRDALKVAVTWPVDVHWNIDEVTTGAGSFRSGDVIPQLLANVQARIMREPKALRVIPGSSDVLPSAFNWMMDRWDTWMHLDAQLYAAKTKFAGDFTSHLEVHGSELAGGGYAMDDVWVAKIAFFSANPGAYLVGHEASAVDDENTAIGGGRFRVDMYLSVDPWTWNVGDEVKVAFKAYWGNAPAQELAAAAKRGGFSFTKIGDEVLKALKQANAKALS